MVLANVFLSSYSFYSLLPCHFVPGFDELLTTAEKAKLYTAIGYSETAANPNLPKNVSHSPSTPTCQQHLRLDLHPT